MERWEETLKQGYNMIYVPDKLLQESAAPLPAQPRFAVRFGKQFAFACFAAAVVLTSIFTFVEPARDWGVGMLGWGEASPSPAEVVTPMPSGEYADYPAPVSSAPPADGHHRRYWGRPASQQFAIDFTGEGLPFDDAMEPIYEDIFFIYQLGQISSSHYFVVFPNGTRIPLMEALDHGHVTIEDCIANGLLVHAELKWEENPLQSGGFRLGLAHHRRFFLNNTPFYPSTYFMMIGGRGYNDATWFRGGELLDFLIDIGLNDAGQQLIERGIERWTIAGDVYFSADELEAAGITVETLILSGVFGPDEIRFNTGEVPPSPHPDPGIGPIPDPSSRPAPPLNPSPTPGIARRAAGIRTPK
jgi:hypothetical protein